MAGRRTDGHLSREEITSFFADRLTDVQDEGRITKHFAGCTQCEAIGEREKKFLFAGIVGRFVGSPSRAPENL